MCSDYLTRMGLLCKYSYTVYTSHMSEKLPRVVFHRFDIIRGLSPDRVDQLIALLKKSPGSQRDVRARNRVFVSGVKQPHKDEE